MKIFFFPTPNGINGYLKKQQVSVFVDEDGRKRIDAKKTKNFIMFNFPILRGITYFILGLIAFLSGFNDVLKNIIADNSTTSKLINKTKIPKITLIYSVLCLFALILSVFMFGYIPSKISFWLVGMTDNFLLRNFVIASVKIVLLFVIFLILRFLPAMQELYKFNAASNLVLNNKGEVKESGWFSYHKSLNFLNFFFFTFLLSIFVITLVGIRLSFWLNWIVNLAIFVGCIALSYEILWLLSLNKKVEKAVIVTSFFVCVKPNITHDEVARVAYSQLNMKEKHFGDSVEKGKIALATLLTEMQTKLAKAGKYEKSDIEWIIATVLNKNRAEAKLVRFFDEKTYREILKATNERANGKPLSAIFGFVDFYGLRFNINKKVLAPRMETEILVDEVIKDSKSIKKCEILDLGTGSGAIAVSLAKNTKAKIYAVDISKSALDVAKENAKNNDVKVEFIYSDLFNNLKKTKKFDIIVSNPPYIRSLDIAGLDEEVKNYDPKLALDGGQDGLDFYRRIALESKGYFKKKGILLLEIGKGQFSQVKKILEKNGFREINGIKDYNKVYRVVRATYGN